MTRRRFLAAAAGVFAFGRGGLALARRLGSGGAPRSLSGLPNFGPEAPAAAADSADAAADQPAPPPPIWIGHI